MESQSFNNKENIGSKSFESERIQSDKAFSEIFSDYAGDMERVENLAALYEGNEPEKQFGKIAESLVFSSITRHPINDHLNFRQTSLYDDYLHGADLVVEPRSTLIQAVAAIDVTTNQEDIKGVQRRNTLEGEARPVGLDAKLARTKRYTDYLAELNPSHARDLSAWLESGGLSEPRTKQNEGYFREAERLFLMKYYKSPDYAQNPGAPTFVIGGPQAVIGIDTVFINKALQGSRSAQDMIADLSVMEFMYCIEAEQKYLQDKVRKSGARNIFFDNHYSKIGAWSAILNRGEINEITQDIVGKNQSNREFREQLGYYAQAFQKVYSR